MNSFTPGIIIALLIVFLLGILVGYALVQRRLRQQAEERKVAQRRLTEMEQSHELRLREATDQLRHDYESQLAATIEHYQDQLSQKTIEMEQIYETRFRVLQQGEAPAPAPSLATAGAAASPARPAGSSPYRGVEAIADDTPQALTQPELMHLKRQYEIRLKEAAQKLQKAYETQLAERTKAARAEIKAEYEQQLADEQQAFTERQADLEQELATLRSETEALQARLESGTEIPTPSQIMGIGDDTTVTLAANTPPGAIAGPDAAQYTQTQLDEQVQAATQQTAAEYEQQLEEQVQAATQQAQAEFDQRLAEQVQAATRQAQTDFDQRLAEQVQAATQQAQTEFDQQLTEQLEAQQVQFDRRFRELEADYKNKLAELENAAPESVLSPVDELFGDSEYDDLASQSEPASTDSETSNLEADLFAEEDFFSTTPSETSTTDDTEGIADLTGELEDDLFADDFFADPPADQAATPQSDNDNNDDDDDDDNNFMPLDLSDIG